MKLTTIQAKYYTSYFQLIIFIWNTSFSTISCLSTERELIVYTTIKFYYNHIKLSFLNENILI